MYIASVGDIIHRGGTILKTARCEEMRTNIGIDEAVNKLKEQLLLNQTLLHIAPMQKERYKNRSFYC